MELYSLTISELRDLLGKKEVSVKDTVNSIYRRIDAVEEKINAFVTTTKDEALKRAEEVQRELDLGKPQNRKSILGIPLAIKDNMCIKGIPTTCSSKILYNFVPPYESTVTSRLMEQGYVLIGKTNMDEFAMGSSTENSGFRVTKNPWIRREFREVQAVGLLQQSLPTNVLRRSVRIPEGRSDNLPLYAGLSD